MIDVSQNMYITLDWANGIHLVRYLIQGDAL